jgi:thiol-disulfide isomerase/thioredoxin
VAWFDGSVEEGFAAAKAHDKPIFLYWGAVWCPPCNQIKAVVFPSPDVAELLKAVVPIFLDGDTERAQIWADRLHVSGYPSMLLLDSSGAEILRLSEAVEVPEFVAAVRSALGANRSQSDAVARALAGQASEDDWNMLAYASWDGSSTTDLQVRLKVFQAIPPTFAGQRALLAARLLESAAEEPPPDEVANIIRREADDLLDAMLGSEAAIFAARSTIVGAAKEIFLWLLPDVNDPRRRQVAERWTKAARWIGEQPNVSLDTRTDALEPEVQLWLIQNPGEVLPAPLLERVRSAAANADARARTPEERHAVISDAAELLADAGDMDGARTLLVKEMKTTNTPWYYQGALARIEQKAGHDEEALDWSAKARESAQGNATRLQWVVADLLLNAKVPGPNQARRVATLLSSYYDLAFTLPDGFAGRNAVRARTVARKATEWTWPEVQAVVSRNRERCQARHPDRANDCASAFPLD